MRKHLMHTTGSSDVRFSTPESTESAIYLFFKPRGGCCALLTCCQFEQWLAIRKVQVHTAARVHLYKYEIPAISEIYLPFSAFSTGDDKQQWIERNGSEAQRKASYVWVTGSYSDLRLPASSGATQVFRICKWTPPFLPVFSQTSSGIIEECVIFTKRLKKEKKKTIFVVKCRQTLDKKVFEQRLNPCTMLQRCLGAMTGDQLIALWRGALEVMLGENCPSYPITFAHYLSLFCCCWHTVSWEMSAFLEKGSWRTLVGCVACCQAGGGITAQGPGGFRGHNGTLMH